MNADPEVMRFVGDGRKPDPVEQEERVRAASRDFNMDWAIGAYSYASDPMTISAMSS
jgi:hypothetical protein